MRRAIRAANHFDRDHHREPFIFKGGPGSGNFGHSGRPGERGGSAPGAGIPEERGMPPGRVWIDHLEGLPKNSLEAHRDDKGNLTPERTALHDKIIQDTLNKAQPVPENMQPVALVMMGGPASGKGALVKTVNHGDFVVVDPDAVKEKLPEYQKAVAASARDAALSTHDESSLVAKQIREKAMDTRRNVILDGTGNNRLKYEATIENLKARGYKVSLMMVDLPFDDALGRMKERAEATGRWVPVNVMEGTYKVLPKNFVALTSKADSFFLYNNNVPRGTKMKLAWESAGGQEKVHDEEYVKGFRSR